MPLYTTTDIDDIIARAKNTLMVFVPKSELKKSITGETVIYKDMMIIESLMRAVQWGKDNTFSQDSFHSLAAYLLHKTDKYLSSYTVATGTVTSPVITGSYYYGDTDYFAALSGGTDAVPYNDTFAIINGQPLLVPFGIPASVNKYNVVKYPVSQGVKTAWENSLANSGNIPDSTYYDIVTIGSFYYIISRVAMSLDPNYTVTYT